MAKVEIYTSPYCGYCHAAKRLLTRKGVQFQEFDVSQSPNLRAEMTKRSNGGRTVPQIFIDGRHVGGCDDIHDMDDHGELDPLLKA